MAVTRPESGDPIYHCLCIGFNVFPAEFNVAVLNMEGLLSSYYLVLIETPFFRDTLVGSKGADQPTSLCSGERERDVR